MSSLATDLFDYVLPPHLVAQVPAARRDQSRLLVVDRTRHAIEHRFFSDLPGYLKSGDLLFRNNAAVLPARLQAVRPTGGQVECFLLRPVEGEQTWRCLVKPGRRLAVGSTFGDPDHAFSAEIIAREADGAVIVRFSTASHESVIALANRVGNVPLPPYIERSRDNDATQQTQRAQDLERYGTVYAAHDRQVAVAAPTAGLHFTPELLAELAENGVQAIDLTLHVGLGTFRPISTPFIESHPIHRELYEIPAAAQHALLRPVAGRRIAVGTTTVRSIEDFLSRHTEARPGDAACIAEAQIFIYPPRVFAGVDALITNFHQPRSTLMCLVAAFLAPGKCDGIAWLKEIYAQAIAREYRFFSYGDAMLIL